MVLLDILYFVHKSFLNMILKRFDVLNLNKGLIIDKIQLSKQFFIKCTI